MCGCSGSEIHGDDAAGQVLGLGGRMLSWGMFIVTFCFRNIQVCTCRQHSWYSSVNPPQNPSIVTEIA